MKLTNAQVIEILKGLEPNNIFQAVVVPDLAPIEFFGAVADEREGKVTLSLKGFEDGDFDYE